MNNSKTFLVDLLSMAFICALSIILSSILLWSLKDAYLWEIDDVEVLSLGLTALEGGQLSWENFIAALMQTEIGPAVDIGRYRPVFYILRILKGCLLVSMSDVGWLFIFHAFALFAFFSAVGICIKRYFSWFWVFLGLFALAAMPFHAGVWWWLSVPEIDVTLWLVPILLGFFWHDGVHRWTWPTLCVGSALAIGSKENFILLLIPMVYLMWEDWKCKRIRYSQILWFLIPLSMSIPVAFTLVKVVFLKGTDVYGVSTGGGAVHSLVLFLTTSMGAFFCYGLVTALLLVRRKIVNRQDINNAIVMIGMIFLLMLGNYVFYRGNDLGGFHRYGFPYQPLFLLAFFVFLWPLQDGIVQFFSRRIGRVCLIRPLSGVLLGIVGVLIVSGVSINSIRISGDVQRQTKILKDFLDDARNYRTVALMATTIHNPSGALPTFQRAGYLSSFHFLPLYGDTFPGSKEQAVVDSDVLLVGFNQPNKKYLLGSFWKRFTYFTHPWTNPHWFQRIEHTHAVRPMAAVFADRPFLPLTAQGDAVFRDDTTLYVPTDHPQPGTLLLQTSVPLPPDHCWRFAVNGQEVGISRVPQGMAITVTADMWAAAPHHPQVLELSMKCVVDKLESVPLPLGLLALVLNGSSP